MLHLKPDEIMFCNDYIDHRTTGLTSNESTFVIFEDIMIAVLEPLANKSDLTVILLNSLNTQQVRI